MDITELLAEHRDSELISINGVPRDLIDWSRSLAGTLVVVLRGKDGSLTTIDLLVEPLGEG